MRNNINMRKLKILFEDFGDEQKLKFEINNKEIGCIVGKKIPTIQKEIWIGEELLYIHIYLTSGIKIKNNKNIMEEIVFEEDIKILDIFSESCKLTDYSPINNILTIVV